MFLRRIPLKHTLNMRELGGYPIDFKSSTRFKVFLRSDLPQKFSDEEYSYLLNYGVKTVIDLRDKSEINISENAFKNVSGVDYYNISLIDESAYNISSTSTEENNISNGFYKLYINIIENHKKIHNIFDVISNTEKGTTIFNCTAGKDRTGIVAALLLLACGVSKNDVICDYEISYTNIVPAFESFKRFYPEISIHEAKSEPEWMEKVINYINSNYGSAKDYLLKIGISSQNIDKIKNKFIFTHN